MYELLECSCCSSSKNRPKVQNVYSIASQIQVVDRHADEDVVLEPHQRVAAEVEEGEARQEAEGAVVDAREAVARQQDLGEMRRRVEEVRQYLLDLRVIDLEQDSSERFRNLL